MTERILRTPSDLDAIDFDKGDGLVPVVAQDAANGAVLMVAYANREALEQSLGTGRMHYWSRSRRELWRKGDTSGAIQQLQTLFSDCDGDAVLAHVHQTGAACHTGDATCFGEGSAAPAPALTALADLDRTLAARNEARPAGSYTVRLLEDENLRLKKLGEETVELTTALVKGDHTAVSEAADLIYHVMVALRAAGHALADVASELSTRARS